MESLQHVEVVMLVQDSNMAVIAQQYLPFFVIQNVERVKQVDKRL